MALTPAEQQELAALEAEEAALGLQGQGGGLSAAEQQELAALDAEEAQFQQQQINAQSLANAQKPIEDELSFGESLIGGLETAAAIGTGALGQAAGGVAGLFTSALRDSVPGSGAAVSKGVSDALTFEPRTIGGKQILGDLGEVLKPIGDLQKSAEQGVGDKVLELTGSETLAALAHTIPEIAIELATAGLASGVSASTKSAVRQGKKIVEGVKATRAERRSLGDAAVEAVKKQETDTGIRQFTSDVLPPETKAGKFAQQGGELFIGGQRQAQQLERVAAVQNIFDNYNVTDGARFEATIFDGIKASIDAKKAEFAKQFEATTGVLDKQGVVPMTNTKRFARSILEKHGRLESISDNNIITDMENIMRAPNNLTFELVKIFRSSVGERLQKVKQGAAVHGSSDLGLLKETYKQLTKDMESFAKRVDPDTARKWKIADNSFSDFAIGNNKQAAKNLIKRGDATPEVVDQLLFSTKKSDHDFLNMNLGGEAKTAVKQRIIQRMLEKSTHDGKELNPNKFISTAQKHREQLSKFFSADEKRAMKEIIDTLNQTRRAQDSKVATVTGQQVLPIALILNPKALIPGAIAAIMEQPKLRNMFVKMKAAKGAKKIQLTKDFKFELEKLNLVPAPVVTSILRETQEERDQNNG